jgi:SNF2 family DNA or RNA helicase
MDGSTGADTRKMWCKFFNRPTSHRMRLFLISTRAGGLGINLGRTQAQSLYSSSI